MIAFQTVKLTKVFPLEENSSKGSVTTAADAAAPNAGNTFIIKGRKRALQEAYSRSLSAKHSYYRVTGQERAKSYKPFLPLLRVTVQHGGSSRIIANTRGSQHTYHEFLW
jgi:hypothetical protein